MVSYSCDPDNLLRHFPAVSTVTRIKEMNAEPSLDGMEYMRELDRGDYNAIRWMQANIKGSPVILETSEDDSSYSYACRVSSNTGGIPAVIGWARHERFWGGRDHEEVKKRIGDVSLIYSTGSEEEAIELIEKYNVTYVYIGTLERQVYDVNTKNSKIKPISNLFTRVQPQYIN